MWGHPAPDRCASSRGAKPEIAGHSKINITLIYRHVLPGQQEKAMDKWDDVLGDQANEKHARMQLHGAVI